MCISVSTQCRRFQDWSRHLFAVQYMTTMIIIRATAQVSWPSWPAELAVLVSWLSQLSQLSRLSWPSWLSWFNRLSRLSQAEPAEPPEGTSGAGSVHQCVYLVLAISKLAQFVSST